MSYNLQACSFLLGRLRSEIGTLRAIVFPGHHTGPRKWLNFIEGVLDTASSYLVEAQTPGKLEAEISKLVVDAEELGDEAYKLLQFVAGADSTQIPRQVVAPFQRWVEGLGIKETIFFRAEHLPNYELRPVDGRNAALLNGASKTLLDALAEITWPVLRVSVPGHAMGLLPHFAVVAHELGHAIQDRIRPDLHAYNTSVVQAVDRAKDRVAKEGITFAKEHELVAQKIVGSWLNELKADAVAHYLVGPAFFFALCGFFEAAARGYGVADTHPPSDLRRALLFQKLNEGADSFSAVLQRETGLVLTEELNSPHIARCPPADQLYPILKQRDGPITAALCVELIPAFQALAPTVFNAARDQLAKDAGALVYSSAQYEQDLKRHLEALCNLVPPIEYRDAGRPIACTLSTILNIGWVALLTKVDRFPMSRSVSPAEPIAARMECLHDLLLKAAELSEARQLWEQV